MHNTIFKKLYSIMLLTLSPLALVAIFGAVYIIVQMITGLEFTAGVSSFIAILKKLAPYFSYLTTIPVILILLALILKNRGEARQKIKNFIDKM